MTTMTTMTTRERAAELLAAATERAAAQGAEPDGVECALAATVVALSDELRDARDDIAARDTLLDATEHTARAREAELTAEVTRLRAIVAGRSTAPTDAEIAAHEAAGGMWLVTWEAIAGAGLLDGPAAVRAADSARRGGYAVPVTRWVAALEGRPCAWPTTGDAAGEAGRGTGGEGR